MIGDRNNRNLPLRRTVTPKQSIRAWSAILNIRLKDTFAGRIRTFNGVVRMCLQTRMFRIFQQQPYAFFNLLKESFGLRSFGVLLTVAILKRCQRRGLKFPKRRRRLLGP